MTEAIALGHDLGHTPFGHAGERALNKIFSEGFAHQKQSVRIVEKLEKGGRGLNLTWEVQGRCPESSAIREPFHIRREKWFAMRTTIAYINHDVDDGVPARRIIQGRNLPDTYTDIPGAFDQRETEYTDS